MSLLFRVSGIAMTLLFFLGAGILIGAHRPGPFQPISETRAINTKTGQLCSLDADHIKLPPGAMLIGPPPCSKTQ